MSLIKWKGGIVTVMAGRLLLPCALRFRIVGRDLIGSDRKLRLFGCRHANTRRIDF
jgi:hypothetical protein